ncbi:MAG: ribonuclease H-like domain-containing protein [Candidatus Limnocylindrales bacterium]
MDPIAAGQLRRSRLGRLRDANVREAAEIVRSPQLPAPHPDRARRLARDVGGEVLQTTQRPIVVVESRERIPRALDGLGVLPEPIDPGRPFVLFDTETTGLGTGTGTLPFLVGVGSWVGDELVTRQLLLPEQSDEAGYLDALGSLIPPDAVLVSYNGRTFDWPLLVARYRLHGRMPPAHAEHLDLLPLARSLWKHRLPDARLASVEAGICGVRRDHDLAGALVPGRYLDYLRHGRGTLLRDVLEHNRQDVVSMALVLLVLSEDLAPVAGGAPSPEHVHPGDLGGLGRAYARKKRHVEALACFDAAMEKLSEPWMAQAYEGIAMDRARTLTRMGLRADAEGAWHAIALEGGRGAAWAWLHVAKHREHDGHDFAGALRATDQARALTERSRLFGQRQRHVERDLSRRVPRLRRRLRATDDAVGGATVATDRQAGMR